MDAWWGTDAEYGTACTGVSAPDAYLTRQGRRSCAGWGGVRFGSGYHSHLTRWCSFAYAAVPLRALVPDAPRTMFVCGCLARAFVHRAHTIRSNGWVFTVASRTRLDGPLRITLPSVHVAGPLRSAFPPKVHLISLNISFFPHFK
jgi:hypothetical protein